MNKEVYKIQCPEHIVFGDPLYFEQYKGQKLRSLVVDYKPPGHFEARLVLLEQKNEQFEGFMERSMEIYLAPAETMKTYLDGMKYKAQKMKEKMIGVDTARYLLKQTLMVCAGWRAIFFRICSRWTKARRKRNAEIQPDKIAVWLLSFGLPLCSTVRIWYDMKNAKFRRWRCGQCLFGIRRAVSRS